MAQNKAQAANPAKTAEKDAAKSAVAVREEEILAFWREQKIFEKSLAKTATGKEFIFYDGPPFATGQPHYGHILPGTIKDVIPRYKTMRGFNVRRQWGWDCHGLPIENLVEKELGLKNKKDILDYGIGKFNATARASVMRYADDWKRLIPRTGRWVNMEDDYKTMDTDYTESVWWSFKTIYDKGLAYEGFKSMLFCPHCETTLSNLEVSQGYRDITDISVYVKFELVDEPGTFLLAWTTTPWTLPGNVALAVNPNTTYRKVDMEKETTDQKGKYIIAESRMIVLEEKVGNKREQKPFEGDLIYGKELIGKKYKPLFDYYSADPKLKNRQNGWKVYGADFVTTEDGTGIVHIAPAFGADDMELGLQENLPFVQHVSTDGRFKPEVRDFAGQAVKPKDSEEDPNFHQKGDIEMIKYLSAHSAGGNAVVGGNVALFAKEKIVHSYPHCWRCDTPLLNYASSSWFIKVTALKDKLVAENRKVKWLPESIRDGRFGKWLDGAKDWAVSRSRFWGAPLPVWRCDKCARLEVFGSIASLRAKLKPRNTYYVMRHGQSENNVQKIVDSNSHAFHLTAEGKVQAAATAESLKGKGINLVITSPFNRTKETGEIVLQKLGLASDCRIEDERLHEINFGIYNNKPLDDYHAYFSSYQERFTKTVPQGENCNDVRKRVGDFISDIDSRYQGKTILIVTHDTPAWFLFSDASGVDRDGAIALHAGKDFFLQNAEVRQLYFVQFPHNEFYENDLHRPGIDDFIYPCDQAGESAGEKGKTPKCAGIMKRVPEVFDTWYDSGSMPYASHHYPFEHLDEFDPKSSSLLGLIKSPIGFPADFIAEGLDQTRGWFYTLIVLSTALFGKVPYSQVVVNGLVLAEDGRKMSKKLKNYPELNYILDKYGADALRYYLMSSPAVHAEDVNFSEKGVDEVYKKLILRLQNVVSFYQLYAGADANTSVKSGQNNDLSGDHQSDNVLDRWILARFEQVKKQVTDSLERYELDRASWPLDGFIDDLSTWYLRRSRDRFKSDDTEDKATALASTRLVLKEFAKVAAPFMPFIAEDIYQKVCGGSDSKSEKNIIVEGDAKSVHLERWPAVKELGSDEEKLITSMTEVRRVVSLGLEARSKAGIKVRQPLAELKIKVLKNSAENSANKSANKSNEKSTGQLSTEFTALIQDEVNVKKVSYTDVLSQDSAEVELDTAITSELKEEGIVRELMRAIQDLRKKQNLQPSDLALLYVDFGQDLSPAAVELKKIMEKNQAAISKTTNLKRIEFGHTSTDLGAVIGPEMAQTEQVTLEGAAFRWSLTK